MGSTPIPKWAGEFNRREIEILILISEGLSNREISKKLYLSLNTVKWYNKRIFNKLGVSRRTQAARMAREYGLLDPDYSVRDHGQPGFQTNLPSQLNSYVGRTQEISDLTKLTQKHRLVVLTGAGGSGKTRLALQTAGEIGHLYKDGVWLVELAPITEPGLVPLSIAQVLGVTARGETELVSALKGFLANRKLLLILDNFEHLSEAGPLAAELLAVAPRVSVLATSRERLNIYGENEYPVLPLSLPDLNNLESGQTLLNYEAVDLFFQRALAYKPNLTIDDDQRRAGAAICVRLDGLPLAIELAASQVKIFPPTILAERLRDDLAALPAGPRGLPSRQRTLHGMIEWSFDLLDEVEKRLFVSMGVFYGGASLEDIEQVCGLDDPQKVLETLYNLVNKNLVLTRETFDLEPRFGMLDTIQDYARYQLAASREYEPLKLNHAVYYADLAERAQMEIHGPRQSYWIHHLQDERENFHTALDWCFTGGENNYGLRIISSLAHFWYYRGTPRDRHWIELGLARIQDAPPDLQAGVLWAAGLVYYLVGEALNARKYLRMALEVYRRLNDAANAAWVMALLSVIEGEIEDDIYPSIIMAQESLAALGSLGDQQGMFRALTALGELARMQGDNETASQYYKEGLAIAEESGGPYQKSIQYLNLSFVAYRLQDYLSSLNYGKQALVVLREQKYSDMATILGCLAGPLNALGYPERAACLLGAAKTQSEKSGIPVQTPDQQDIIPILEGVRQILDETTFEGAWQAGREMTIQQAYDYALGSPEFDHPEGPGFL